jgi:hypothetical protein
MELYDDAFHVTYPCWFVVHKSSVVSAGEGKVRFADNVLFVFIGDDEGHISLPVFTDQDAAERFIEASGGLEEATFVAAENREMLLDVLGWVTGTATGVVFDPQKVVGWSRRTWPLDYARGQLKTDEGLR